MSRINQDITTERVERLLSDLQYELTRALHQGHILEELGARVWLHDDKGKIWRFEFRLSEDNRYNMEFPNKLTLVKK